MRRVLFLVVLLICTLSASAKRSAESSAIPTILTTDLSEGLDSDDWFDTYLFLKCERLKPMGIVLEHYATEPVIELTKELLDIADAKGLPIKRGVTKPMRRNPTTNKVEADDYTEGAEFILEVMRKSKEKVRLIAVGSLRNEALAYSLDPELFLEKVESIQFAGGTYMRKPTAININRDKLAAHIILNLPVKIVALQGQKYKLSGKDEARIAECKNEICQFLTDRQVEWRKQRGADFLQKTGQLMGDGKNLWSLPLLIDPALYEELGVKITQGDVAYDMKFASFNPNKEGTSVLMECTTPDKVTNWCLDLYLNQ